jgi:polysaccharide biosynthesis/export protein
MRACTYVRLSNILLHQSNKKIMRVPPIWVFIAALVACLTTSCSTARIAYMHDITDTAIYSAVQNLEPVLQKNDLISIAVSSVNPEATQIFNVTNNNMIGGANSSISNNGYANQALGYLVNQEGFIEFPILGSFRAAGLTKKALSENIRRALVNERLLKDPIVNIRYLNYKVTVLGEVGKPMVINVPNEKITLLEALGLAGDATIYGKRTNVLLIRETGDQKIVRRINLNAPDFLSSPYFNLQSNDVIYIEPNKARVSSSGTAKQWLPVVISGLTLMVVAVDRFAN